MSLSIAVSQMSEVPALERSEVYEKIMTKAPLAVQDDNEPLRTVDDLVRQRARTMGDSVVVAYPSSGINYVDYTMRQLDIFAYRVACHYQPRIPMRTSSTKKPEVVAVLGPSNLEYLITMLGLMKLGHTILFLSTRISAEAIASLVKTTDAHSLLVDPRYAETAAAAVASLTASRPQVLELAARSVFEFSIDNISAGFDTRLDVELDHAVEMNNHVYIIHSSGSTGFPKPIFQTQKAAIVNYAANMNMRAFITLPLYHNHGICNLFRAVYSGKSIHMYNADLPLTTGYLEEIMGRYDFEIFYGVPYALKLLAESKTGIKMLKKLKVVMYGGSACPDELGNTLVDAGVNLVGHYGATEVGQLMTSFRAPGDKAWNYVRETDTLSPFLNWIPRGPNLFECCVREGWPAKLTSNMPDGSYATKDLFEPHPTIPRAWKYVARLDDTIALVNGEKFSPVSLEGRIRSDSWVTEAVAFGSGRPYIGLLLIPASSTAGLAQEAIVDHIWPVVEAGNRQSEAYGRLARNMIRVLPANTPYPRTDKGSIIRQAFYHTFSADIDAAYDEADRMLQQQEKSNASISLDEVKDFLRFEIAKTLGSNEAGNHPTEGQESDDMDFLALGMDSLQAIQLRQEILRGIDVGGQNLGSNVVFDYPTVAKLAAYLHNLRTGNSTGSISVEEEMKALIDKYTTFSDVPSRQRSTVVVTGVTGSLGAHVVARLSGNAAVQNIYCLVRARDETSALRRVRDSMLERRVWHTLTPQQRNKLRAVPFDQSAQLLGLQESTYWKIASSLRAVIHCAWAVNFNLRLSSFERDCIAGVQHLLSLCLAAGSGQARPATFSFCSSVSAMARFPGAEVPETLPEFGWAQGMGYAQSKAVAEHICARAAKERGVPARVMRVGQIVADTHFGIWNATEAIPLMLQSALTIGALPRLPEQPSWLPVDTVAQAVLDIALSEPQPGEEGDFILANVANSRKFDWTADLLPALREAGLSSFEEVSPREWVQRLRASDADPVANPPIKLVEFFASKYDHDDKDFFPSKSYVTEKACRLSPALAAAPVLDPALVRNFVHRFLSGPWKIEFTSDAGKMATKKRAIVLYGLFGSKKTTVGEGVAKAFGASFVDGDALQSRNAVASVSRGIALPDAERIAWLGRLHRYVREAAYGLGYDVVVVSCSSLQKSYRDTLRKLRESETTDGPGKPLDVFFIDLHDSVEQHMAESSTEAVELEYDTPTIDEEDVAPIGASGTTAQVVEEVCSVLRHVL